MIDIIYYILINEASVAECRQEAEQGMSVGLSVYALYIDTVTEVDYTLAF
jgi:hypothetical protein